MDYLVVRNGGLGLGPRAERRALACSGDVTDGWTKQAVKSVKSCIGVKTD
jgi:hypothetical protein